MINSQKNHQSIVYFVLIFSLLISSLLFAQKRPSEHLNYQMPPREIAEIVDAPPTPSVNIAPNGKWMLILDRPNLPSIEEVSQPILRIAGIRINPRTNGPSRQRYYTGIKIKNIFNDKMITIQLPDKARISNIDWSPDGKWIAFTLTKTDKIELWVAEINSGTAKRLIDSKINDAYGAPFQWLSDNRTIICLTVPGNRGKAPQKQITPVGPVIQENLGKKAPARTYQDLLKNSYDESLFEYYLTSQIISCQRQSRH